MERAYKKGTLYAFLLVGLLTAVIVRRTRESILATISLVLGTICTIGLMFAFALPFNLGNVFGFPLILGAGAEFGLNVVLRYGEARHRGGARPPPSPLFSGAGHRATPRGGVRGPLVGPPPGPLRRRALLTPRPSAAPRRRPSA